MLSKLEKKYLKEVEALFKNQTSVNFTDEQAAKYQDILLLLSMREVIRDLKVDGGNLYFLAGSFEIFNEWLKDQEKTSKKLSGREWKIAIVSAIIGGLIGLIPTIINWIGGM